MQRLGTDVGARVESIQGVSDCKVNTDTYMWVFCEWNASQLTKHPLHANSSALAAYIGVNNLKVVLKNTISDLLFLKLREAAYVHRLTDSKLVFGSNVICLLTRGSHAMYLSRPPDALKSLIRLYVGLRTGYDLGYIAFWVEYGCSSVVVRGARFIPL